MATITNSISIYTKANDVHSEQTIPLDIFFDQIRDGTWQDYAIPIRLIQDKKERLAAKERVPNVTISGTFKKRVDAAIDKHSGYIGIDIDNVEDVVGLKNLLTNDRYVIAAFISISGRGLCVVFRINAERHRESFQGISEYLYNSYKLIIDPTSINVSRARYVSYDPDIYVNADAAKFTQYPKEKEPKKIDRVIYSKDDFTEILKQIVERKLNITQDSYHVWLRLAFALVHKFGEAGREYFHIISQYSSKYDATITDKQFTACLRHQPTGQPATISMFYYYAKEAGVELYSQRTKLIVHSASQGKKGGLNAVQVAENLSKFEDIINADDIIKQVFDSDVEIREDGIIEQLELFLRQNYNLERNLITRYIENNGQQMEQKDLNDIYIKAKKIIPKTTYDLLDRLINSKFVTAYNPFFRYFDQYKDHDEVTGYIERLFATIHTRDAEYLYYFGTKWLVSVISAIHGNHSPLMLVLSGEAQNTGKTQWFRRLLPEALHKHGRTYPDYYAESKLDAGKDDEILMTQMLIIMDDEMGGKSKREDQRLKELTSKQTFSLREPYGRNNVHLNRIAVLAGTTNSNEVLNDPTGNRRIIPIHVNSIDHDKYNSINKDLLWLQAWQLYKSGYNWELTMADIKYLGQESPNFTVANSEAELIQRYFKADGDSQLTATDIKVYLEQKSQQRLSLDRIGKELKRLGFGQLVLRSGNSTRRVYLAGYVEAAGMALSVDDLPF